MLNPTRVISILIFVALALPSFSQIDFKHFPIDSFKLPDIEWKALRVGGGFGSHYDYLHDLDRDRHYNASDFSSNANIAYSGFINRPDVQSSYNITTNPDFSVSHQKRDFSQFKYKDRFGNYNLFTSWTRLKYHGSSFFEFGLTPNISTNNSRVYEEMNSILRDDKQSTFTSDIDIPIGFGRGRIEPVSDIVMALFLLQDAVNIGLAPDSIQKNDVFLFGELMATVRNERVFDYRRKRIFEFRKLYDFMLDKGWTIRDDPGFFTVLTDNWIYNLNNQRNSGNRWTYLITPALSYRSQHQESLGQPNQNFVDYSVGSEASIAYEHYKPQNLYRNFQRTHRLGVEVVDLINILPESFFFPATKSTKLQLHTELTNTIGYGWFPNSRTQIFTNFNFRYNFYKDLKTEFIGPNPDKHVFDISISGQCHYFLSYRTQFNINASLGYTHSIGSTIDVVGGNFFVFSESSDGFKAMLNASFSTYLF